MSELPITPSPAPPGLEPLGSSDAGMCVDGVCSVPQDTAPADREVSGAAVDPKYPR